MCDSSANRQAEHQRLSVLRCVCFTWEDGVEVHWRLVCVHSDLKLGAFGRRGRNTHQQKRKTEPGLKNSGNS